VIARIASTPARDGGPDWATVVAGADPEILTAPADAIVPVLRRLDEDGGARAWLLGHGTDPDALDRLERRLAGH
jgi:hypothetical protein